jgi:hypothetical protein
VSLSTANANRENLQKSLKNEKFSRRNFASTRDFHALSVKIARR